MALSMWAACSWTVQGPGKEVPPGRGTIKVNNVSSRTPLRATPAYPEVNTHKAQESTVSERDGQALRHRYTWFIHKTHMDVF